MSASIEKIIHAEIAGRSAANAGKTDRDNPHPWRDWEVHLAWFNAWHVRHVELQENCILLVDRQVPNDEPKR